MKKFLVVISTIFLVSLAINVFSEQLMWGTNKDLSELSIQMETERFTDGNFTEVISINVDIDSSEIYKTEGSYDILDIKDLQPTGKPGEPVSLMKAKKVILPANSKITGIKMIDGQAVEVKNRLNLSPVPDIAITMPGVVSSTGLQRNDAISQKDEFFPGKAVSYVSGSDGKNTIVYIQLYPVQYNPVGKKAVLIKNATFEVDYIIEDKILNFNSGMRSDAENIIITTADFESPATELKNLHESLEGVSTDIITTQWIDDNCQPAEEPDEPGYANISTTPISDDYDYDLAQKITAYLRDDEAHPNLQSVTILGDADIVPPSYYFYIPWHNEYSNWIASDLFYSSPDYDYILNYGVGRLPVGTEGEAQAIVHKYENWKTNLSEEWFRNVQLTGAGIIVHKNLLSELSTLEVVNNGFLKGMNVGKNFHSNGKENRESVLPYFSDENTGIIYHNGHGSGTKFYFGFPANYTTISYDDLMALPPAEKYPVVFSTGCKNAGFDAEILIDPPFENCVAEGVLRSSAGGIAYFGSTRTTFGQASCGYNEIGEIVYVYIGYADKMHFNYFKNYSQGITNMGEIAKNGFNDYMQYANPADDIDRVFTYEWIFLGDPAFSLLPMQGSMYDDVDVNLSPEPNEHPLWIDPIYYITNDNAPSILISGETNSPSVNLKIYGLEEVEGEDILVGELANFTDNSTPFDYSFIPNELGLYFISYETEDFKEKRFYFQTQLTSNLPPTTCQLYEVQPQGEGYNLFWSPSYDFDDSIDSYNIREMSHPIQVTEHCDNFYGWKNDGFRIQENGYNGSNGFYSGIGRNLSHTVTTIIPVLIEPNQNLTFRCEYAMQEDEDFAYVEISTDGESWDTLLSLTGTHSFYNEVSVDLDDYSGESVFIRFRYESNDEIQLDAELIEQGICIDEIHPAIWFNTIDVISDIQDTMYNFPQFSGGEKFYQVQGVDTQGNEGLWSNIQIATSGSGIIDAWQNQAPERFSVDQNYPNPFNPTTTIGFATPEQSHVCLKIYDITGKLIKTLIDKSLEAGYHSVVWDGKGDDNQDVSSGIYLYKIDGQNHQTRQMILLK